MILTKTFNSAWMVERPIFAASAGVNITTKKGKLIVQLGDTFYGEEKFTAQKEKGLLTLGCNAQVDIVEVRISQTDGLTTFLYDLGTCPKNGTLVVNGSVAATIFPGAYIITVLYKNSNTFSVRNFKCIFTSSSSSYNSPIFLPANNIN